jgi:sn-glycerol 3-phosphate transport system permease protein
MPGLGLLDHYLAKLFGPMNNNWLGRSNSALLALALIGVEVRRLLHAVFPRRAASIRPLTRKRRSMEGATRTQVFLRSRCCCARP